MTVVTLLPEAGEELEAAALHYESLHAGLGRSLLTEVTRACSRIAELPRAGRVIRDGLRRKLVRRFPYYILYRVTDREILVVAIAHRRRQPGYWRSRL